MNNILIIANSDFPASSAVHIHHFANGLINLGLDCVVAVPNDKYSVKKIKGSLYQVMQHNEIALVTNYFKNAQPPDIVHGWTPREHIRNTFVSLASHYEFKLLIHLEDNEESILSRSFNIPASDLLTMDETLIPYNLSHPHKYKEFLSLADGVTVIIDNLKKFIPETIPSLLLYPGVDTQEFYPRPKNNNLAESLGIPSDTTIICYTGTVYPSNRDEVKSLYLAIGKRNKRGKPTILLRTGANGCDILNPEDLWVEKYIIDLGWVERPQIPDILALADVLIQPGKADEFNDYRFPSKIPEFMAMGKPVILPQTNIALSMTHLQDAFILPVVDENTLQDAIASIIENPQLYEQLSQGSLKFAQNHFSWEKSTEKLVNFYRSIDKNNYQSKWQKGKYINQQILTKLAQYKQENKILTETVNLSDQKKLDYEDKIRQLEAEIEQLTEEIIAMKTSKFWRMRHQWFKLKNKINLLRRN